jgi:tetratricopeptide (TPR) repeat protein
MISALLALAVLAGYWQVLGHDFIASYDDTEYVVENYHVHTGPTLENLKWAFKSFHASNWHPLTWISHMLDCRLYDLHPWGHHLTALLLHIANTVLLFVVLNRMTLAPWRSAFAAALFGVHPLHVESVAWISERKDVLSTLFWMLTLWAYVRYTERPDLKRYLPVAVFFALGLMAKPMLVTLPFVLLLLDYWPLGRFAQFKVQSSRFKAGAQATNTQHRTPDTESKSTGKSTSGSTRRIVWEKAPLFALAAASSIVTFMAQHGSGAVGSFEQFPLGIRAANSLAAYAGYVIRTLWPHRLAAIYPHPENTLPEWHTIVSAVFLVCVSLLAILAARRRRYLAVGWLWYLGTLVPVIGLAQVGGQAMADRYTYIPLIGLFMIVAWGVPDVFEKGRVGEWGKGRMGESATGRQGESATPTLPHSHTPILAVPAVAIVVLLTALTWRQVGYWHDGIRLFNYTIAVTGDNYLAQDSLAVAYEKEGKYAEAVSHYRESLRLKPRFAQVESNLGNALLRMGRGDEAVTHYSEALRIMPNYPDAHNNLGVALEKQGKLDEALREYRESLRLRPDDPVARRNLMNALEAKGSPEEAAASFSALIEANPNDAEAHYYLGDALSKQNKTEEAAAQFSRALELNPGFAEAHLKLGLLLSRQQKIKEAEDHYRQALRTRPRYAEAHLNLGNTLAAQGATDEAISHYEQALAIRPKYAEAHFNLGVALSEKGRPEEAVAHYREALRIKPGDADIHNNLAIALYFKGDYAAAWNEVRLCRKFGGRPHPDFIAALNQRMREPR